MKKVIILPDELNKSYRFANQIVEKYSDKYDFLLVGKFSDDSAILVIREKAEQEEKEDANQSG